MSRQSATQAKLVEGSAPGTPASLVGSLAQFFAGATPLRLPVQLEMVNGTTEQVVIEFGTSEEVIFASRLPLEFGDRLKISTSDNTLMARAEVVALQFHAGEAAVAARFSERVPNWIVKS